jgi:hypothetical protein
MPDNININDCLNNFLLDEAKAKVHRRVQVNLLRNHEAETLSADDALPGFNEILTLAVIRESTEEKRAKKDSISIKLLTHMMR